MVCCNSPSNLLDDLTHKGGALAQVSLGAGNTGLDDTSGSLLYLGNKPKKTSVQRPSSAREVEGRDPPRGEIAS